MGKDKRLPGMRGRRPSQFHGELLTDLTMLTSGKFSTPVLRVAPVDGAWCWPAHTGCPQLVKSARALFRAMDGAAPPVGDLKSHRREGAGGMHESLWTALGLAKGTA